MLSILHTIVFQFEWTIFLKLNAKIEYWIITLHILKVIPKMWNHHCFTYNHAEGRISLYSSGNYTIACLIFLI